MQTFIPFMSSPAWLPWLAVALGLVAACAALGAWAASRRAAGGSRSAEWLEQLLDQHERAQSALRAELAQGHRGLREEFAMVAQGLRSELAQGHETLRSASGREALAAREESAAAFARLTDQLRVSLHGLTELNDRRLHEMRQTVDQRLQSLQTDNAAKLDEMRRTVDEKLHATLEQRLGESFRLVSERLEAVHHGLGEMQNLAAGVGDLKRVLTNVKSRGTWGEVQLGRLIEDTMTPNQYARNIKPVPGSDALVEFAIRLPGQNDNGTPVWLPIDAKFPKEEYERLLDAEAAGDAEAARAAAAALARAVEVQARQIAAKYIAPPHTTDFAILFLPTESLYARVLDRPGLLDRLQALRINVAGPSNLTALLNSLQMGFRTLAIEQRSSEVWQVLRAVKTEFQRFGESLAGVKRSLDAASNKIGQTEVRSRVMMRSLNAVEALPEGELLPWAEEEQGSADPGEAGPAAKPG